MPIRTFELLKATHNPREHRMAEPHKEEERTQTKCREFPRVPEVRAYVKRPASDIFSTGKCIFYVLTVISLAIQMVLVV